MGALKEKSGTRLPYSGESQEQSGCNIRDATCEIPPSQTSHTYLWINYDVHTENKLILCVTEHSSCAGGMSPLL